METKFILNSIFVTNFVHTGMRYCQIICEASTIQGYCITETSTGQKSYFSWRDRILYRVFFQPPTVWFLL